MTLTGTVICAWTMTVGLAVESSALQRQATEAAESQQAVIATTAPAAESAAGVVRPAVPARQVLARPRLKRTVRPGVGPYGDMYDVSQLSPMPPSRQRPPTLLNESPPRGGGLFGKQIRRGRRSR